MLFPKSFFLIGVVASVADGLPGNDHHEHDDPHHKDHANDEGKSLALNETCYGKVTVVDTQTVLSTTTLPTTCYVEVTDYVYVNSTVTQNFTENMTKTLHHTIELTDTEHETETETETETEHETETETDTVAITETDTDSVTVTTTDTVPATITTYTTETETLLSTTYDPCPKSCSIDAATVTLFFWPTDRPYTYPSTYVDEDLDYTFVSPSVYMLIPWASGTNSEGQHVGPSTTNWILGLDLDEVSTIADGPSGSLTRQLELSDLGTQCPQSMDPTAIATLNDSECAPILAAPTTVSSWAYPCNACGRFGLFDPPYAVPTITGLIEPTTTPELTTTEVAETMTAEPTGTLYVVYYDEDGEPSSTDTRESVGMNGESTSSVTVSLIEPTTPFPTSTDAAESGEVDETPEEEEPTEESTEEEDAAETGGGEAQTPLETPTDVTEVVPTPSDPDVVPTAAAHKLGSSLGAMALVWLATITLVVV